MPVSGTRDIGKQASPTSPTTSASDQGGTGRDKSGMVDARGGCARLGTASVVGVPSLPRIVDLPPTYQHQGETRLATNSSGREA